MLHEPVVKVPANASPCNAQTEGQALTLLPGPMMSVSLLLHAAGKLHLLQHVLFPARPLQGPTALGAAAAASSVTCELPTGAIGRPCDANLEGWTMVCLKPCRCWSTLGKGWARNIPSSSSCYRPALWAEKLMSSPARFVGQSCNSLQGAMMVVIQLFSGDSIVCVIQIIQIRSASGQLTSGAMAPPSLEDDRNHFQFAE